MKGNVGAVRRRKAVKKHRLYHHPSWREVRNQIPQGLRNWEQGANTSKEDWKWQKRNRVAPSE